MKFAEKLAAHITPEWNSQYIKYDVRKFFSFFVFNWILLFFDSLTFARLKFKFYPTNE